MSARRLAGLLPLLLAAAAGAAAQEPLEPRGEAPAPRFDRLHRYEELVEHLHGYARAYPDWVELEAVAESAEGRPLWLLTITNPATGPHDAKPAMYVDGNIHANEVQGAEAALYVVDALLTGYGRLPRATELLDRATFYVLPVVNPDGRARWFDAPATPHFPRTVAVPVDDDRDGLADEDGYDDLNGDGVITRMRKRVPPGEGTHVLDPADPRLLVRADPDELGEWVLLGWEGRDSDGDGRVNEDPIGYVDPNRTFGFDWQPRYVQRGAGDYPLQIPETRGIAEWALAHPNVAAAQSFHNAGRMILRGPGSKDAPAYPRGDLRAYEQIAAEGERILPGYRKLVVHEDLYTVHGSTIDHFYMLHGAISFTNEMWGGPARDLDGDGKETPEERLRFSELLTLGRQFVPWAELEHPDYGAVEVGGYRHDVGRVPEGWQLEEELHRNAAFVLFHAWHLPRLAFGEPAVRRLAGDTWRVEVPVVNDRAIPSVTEIAVRNALHRLDVATVEGARVLAAGVVTDPLRGRVRWQRHRPARLEVEGIPGMGRRRLVFLVEGEGEASVVYDGLKAGRQSVEVELAE